MAFITNGITVIDNSGNAKPTAYVQFPDGTYQISAHPHNLSAVQNAGGTRVHTLDNPNAYNTSSGDGFGLWSAISGNYAIVGAPFEGDAGGINSGKAYIFNVTTGALLHTLNNPNPFGTSEGDNFGRALAISGNYAIVGAVFEDDAGGTTSGKAYIYNVTTGALVHTLNNPNPVGISVGDIFGVTVGISGNYAIVGAYQEDDTSSDSGKAYIYNVITGALVHTLNNPNAYSTSASDFFGRALAISGNYAIVSATFEDAVGASNSGKAYIFNVTTGALVHTLDNPSPFANDNYGFSVAISGNYAIVGVRSKDDNEFLDSGKAYIYNVTTGQLLHTLNNPNAYTTPDFDRFGTSVGISGDYAIVGANLEDSAGGTSSGKAYIFNVTTGALVYTLNNPNAYGTEETDNFGESVAISNNYAIVSTSFEDDAGGTSSGKAYIFAVKDLTLIDKLYTLACSP